MEPMIVLNTDYNLSGHTVCTEMYWYVYAVNIRLCAFTVIFFLRFPDVFNLSVSSPVSVLATESLSPAVINSSHVTTSYSINMATFRTLQLNSLLSRLTIYQPRAVSGSPLQPWMIRAPFVLLCKTNSMECTTWGFAFHRVLDQV